jgi:uncharacterized protein YjdB
MNLEHEMNVARDPLRLRRLCWLLAAVAACGDGSVTDEDVVESLSVAPPAVTLAIGATQPLTVTATYDDGTQRAVASGVAWESMTPATATVSAGGVVTGVAAGSTTVTARFGGKSGTTYVTVNAAPSNTLAVFDDDYGAGIGFAPFAGTINAVTIDSTESHSGAASLKIVVPSSAFTGGAFELDAGADLSGYDAVTFWARSSRAATLDVAGLGNDTASVLTQCEATALPLSSTWTKHVIPLPLPARLTGETGLFHFAEGSEAGSYTIWLDDIQYEKLGGTVIGPPNPAIASATVDREIGELYTVTGTTVSFAIGTASRTVTAAPAYFSFLSSNPAVATVDAAGVVSAVGNGSARITARLGSVDARGAVDLTVGRAAGTLPVFLDDYGDGVSFTPFVGSTNAIAVDRAETHAGSGALRIAVPATGFTGGALTLQAPAALSGYDAVSFWARASKAATLDTVGFGNDGSSATWVAERDAVPLSTSWTRVVIPIPLPARLTAVSGLFHFAEGAVEGDYTIWIDDVQFETLGGAIGAPAPAIAAATVERTVGDSFAVTGTAVGFAVDGVEHTVRAAPAYFSFTSSDPAVATVDAAGGVSVVGVGSTTITARLGAVDASGAIALTAVPQVGPLVVFADGYGAGVSFAGFSGAVNAVSLDTAEKHSGTTALKILVPAGGYTGGALVSDANKNLTAYDAVTFWAKASKAATLDTAGLGVTAASTTWLAEWRGAPLTTAWTKYVVPIPLAAKLTASGGLFHFAENAAEGAYTIWIDDVSYETLGSGVIRDPVPAVPGRSLSKQVGETVAVDQPTVGFTVNGASRTIVAARPYFSFTSSSPGVASVDANGLISALAVGTSSITARLGARDATGVTTITVTAPSAPAVAAPAPTRPAAGVISLFSDAYPSVTVDTWLASWSNAMLADVLVAGNNTKKYTNDVYAGVEFFATATVDASAMVAFHLDVWTPDSTQLRIKLVDFGADRLPGGAGANADSEAELTFDAASTPPLVTGSWMQLDLPFTAFRALNPSLDVAHLAQLVISGSTSTIYVDNVYFHN